MDRGNTPSASMARPAPQALRKAPMTVSVLLFASLAEALGRDRMVIELEAPVTAGQLRDDLLASVDRAAIRGAVRVAVNECFVADSSPVRSGDEVALIPPVAGG